MKKFIEEALENMEKEEYYEPSRNNLHLFTSVLYDAVVRECGYDAVEKMKINLYYKDSYGYDEFRIAFTLQFYFDHLDDLFKSHRSGDDIFIVEVHDEEIFVYTSLWCFK